ncbi:MAG: response regulator [Bacteriovoracia bacterium]
MDDDVVLRDTIVFDFKRKGFKVFAAENGTNAFDIVKSQNIDLVLSDIRMPNGDGIELLEKTRVRDPKIPIIILITGFSDANESELIQKGALQVIHKPFDRKKLMDSVILALGISSNE